MNTRKEKPHPDEDKNILSRRSALKALAGIPVLGLFGYELFDKISWDKKKQSRLIKELGLEDIHIQQKVPAVSKGDLIRIGIIGFGNRANALANGLGFMHPETVESYTKSGRLKNWLEQENLNVAITGICDVFDMNAERGLVTAGNELLAGGAKPSGLKVKRYRTYREMLDDDSIDAVVIATPDHHHARMTTDAVKAGKHVFCEKSIALHEDELQEVYHTVKNSDRVFQLGHQITKNVVFQQAKEIIKRGILGKIALVETTTNRNSAEGAWIRHLDEYGNPKPGSLKTIDWEQWLGDCPKVPFTIDRFYNWTKFFDYDTGMLGQLFTHEFDAVNQLLNIGIPKSAVSSGGIYFWKDNREIPDQIQSVFEYPDKELTLMYSGCLANSRQRGRYFMGPDASMELSGTLTITADNDSVKYKKQLEAGLFNANSPMIHVSPGSGEIDAISTATEKYYASRGLTTTKINGKEIDVTHLHLKEWIDCIRNGGETSSNIERAYEEGITVLMAHKSYVEKRRVEWDPVRNKII
ncbi:putative dehydrogenase [Proteiniphilum saccharofermentans]|jgi:predicted dehydrogenase|uniref:Putative dehydrogenase n=1 Tax=Proteiniphilum saccharofermentans TaxID=1642647 RepID=A0A1R3T0S4_9BACT|nr:Gfo/Idh/MocA family oxidoreductase [Proteiniphilum saccharofermentans]NLU28400.1 Gfo/Idh/MocA family oxidoreductase [Bacteroidales bacterium]SCD22006.1 putative dehydrogenase [Proteiniphilum saccharofermentans]